MTVPLDVTSIDAMIKALYEAISFRVGESPDWNRLRSLFVPAARLIHAKAEGAVIMDVPGFIANYQQNLQKSHLAKKGFFEIEIARQVEHFDNIAQVFSTYESRHTIEDSVPIARGINSIQLIRENQRWWIISILWVNERPEQLIPPQYLPDSKA